MTILRNILRVFYFLILGFTSLSTYCQLKQINTGTNAYLYDLSIINKNIVINGNYDYLVKSYNECNNLTPLAIPGPTGNITRLQRPDSNNMYLLSYNPSQTLTYKSTDGGNNWLLKSTTSGAFSHEIGFFDSTEALMTDGPYLWRTTNSGSSWTSVTSPFPVGTTTIKTYDDSMVCLAGVYATGWGIKFSKDKGITWPYGYGEFGNNVEVTDFFFLNRDTIFSITSPAGFINTVNGGQTWTSNSIPAKNAYGLYFKNAYEGYIVGVNELGKGVILKTIDLGKTWASFNTGITTTLTNIALLDDSIAILTGNNGVLLRWNYKNTMFTGMDEYSLNHPGLKVFPNPVQDKLHFEFDSDIDEDLELTLSNTLGQIVYSKIKTDPKELLDLSFLNAGIYYLEIEGVKSRKVFKVIKE